MISLPLAAVRAVAAKRPVGYLQDVLASASAIENDVALLEPPAYWALVEKYRPRPGLGDMVASGLATIGVTKERAQRAASLVGIKDCGCGKRQAALNSLGRRLGLGGK